MIKDTIGGAVMGLQAKRTYRATLIMVIFSFVVNILIMYLLRRFRASNGGRISRSSKGSSKKKERSKRRVKDVRKKGPCLLLLLGIPGSGKTTWLKHYLQHCEIPYVVINAESIEEKLRGESQDCPDKVRVREAMINYIVQNLIENRDVVVDSVYAMEKAFRHQIMCAVPSCNWLVKEFPLKVLFAHIRLVKRFEEGMARHCPSEAELEEMEKDFFAAQAHTKKEGWKQLLDFSRHRSRR